MILEDIVALHKLCFPEAPWSHDSCATLLDQPMTALYTVDQGFLIASLFPPEGEILTICVHPDKRRQGKAGLLIHLLFQDVDIVHLEVAADNADALSMYEAMGFAQSGLRPAYYARADGTKVDALVMQRAVT
ncbi:MAG: GNAT family N-acetyltransferase [Aliishimia sp.]